MEILIYYVLPNIVLFGSLYALAKIAEHVSWWTIENYREIIEKFAFYR